MDDFLLELDEGSEGMQSTIILLQQELKESKEQIAQLQQENKELQSYRSNTKDDSDSVAPMDTDTERTSQMETSNEWETNQPAQQTNEMSEATNGHLDSQGEGMETDSSESNRVPTTDTIPVYRTRTEVNHSTDGDEQVIKDVSSEVWSSKDSKQMHHSNSKETVEESLSSEETVTTKKVLRTDSQEDGFHNGSLGSPDSLSQESET